MNRQEHHLDPELDVLLEGGKVIQPVPEIVRARTLSRARSAMAAMAVIPHEPISFVRRRGLTVALAASLALAAGAAVATAALMGRTPSPIQPAPPAIPHAERPMHPATFEMPQPSPMIEPPPAFTSKPQRLPRSTSAQESYAAELDLLARAQVACASREFSNALVLVAEHGRKFPSGRLAEEREALRVRALEGAGRTDEARRAAASFASRFPRSIMVPRQSGEPKL
jgi:hypothetical protein